MSPTLARRFSVFSLIAALPLILIACLPTPAPQPPRSPVASSALVLSSDGGRLAAVNPDSDSITLVDAQSLQVISEIPVGDDPRTVAFTPDGSFALVANHGSGTVSIIDTASAKVANEIGVGGRPYGIVADASRAYVSLSALAQIAVIDFAARAVSHAVQVEPFPSGLALAGDALYVTHLYSGRVTHIDLRSLTVRQVISTGADSNLSQSIALSPGSARAYLPQTRSNTDSLSLGYDSTVLLLVSVLDLAVSTYVPAASLQLHSTDRPVNLPFAAAVSLDGKTLYVANAGSDDVSVIDLTTSRAVAHIAAGRNPRGLALSPDGSRLFVNNTLDGALSIFDLLSPAPLLPRTLVITTLPLPENVLTGKRLFNTSLAPMSTGGWISCAACHFNGGMDGRTWLGFPDGPRNTSALFGVERTSPFHWRGDLDELQDVELTIRRIQHGAGLIRGEVFDSLGQPNAGRSAELDALAAYLASLEAPLSPYTNPDGTLAESARRGEHAFRRWGCAACHPAPLYTDLRVHLAEVGDRAITLDRAITQDRPYIDTPSLIGVWATAPYFHDGSAPTLQDTIFARGFHSMGFAMGREEVEDLIAFLQSLPYRL